MSGIGIARSLKLSLALLCTFLVSYLVLIPLDAPLYDLILFPFPDPRTPDVQPKLQQLRNSGVIIKDVAFKSANGRLLHGWFLQVPNTHRVFLYCHAKGNNIYGKLHVASALLLCGGSVLIYDYQGYGCSEGKPSIEKACDDAVAGYDYLIEKEHRKPNDIVAFGESFGCGVVGQLVLRRTISGAILHSGATSLMRAGRDQLFWLNLYPDCLFPKQDLDNIAVFSAPHPPLLIIHGKLDKTLSFQNAQDLFNQAVPPKQLFAVETGGHCSFGQGTEVVDAIKRFLAGNPMP